jgi:enoyl-CoA hydratase
VTAFWRFERDGAVSRFRLDSDDGRQTLSPEVLTELAAGATRESERGGAVIVVESCRERIFAAGADLAAIRELDGPSAHSYAREGQEALRCLSRVCAAVVALIDGACFGGALDLAMACDLRLASGRASFCHPGPRLGFITGWGGTVSAPRLLGNAGARRLFRNGEVFDAGSALKLGLVDEVIPAAQWPGRARQIEKGLEQLRALWDSKPWA